MEALGVGGLKDIEVTVIHELCECFRADLNYQNIGRGFHLNYKIPQIGKEFDLLKIDEKRIVNIELKSEQNEEAILNQLKRNYYYLKFT